MKPSEPRTARLAECDHMRPVVHDGECWRHVLPDGILGAPCGCNFAYRVKAQITGEHYLSERVREVVENQLPEGGSTEWKSLIYTQ